MVIQVARFGVAELVAPHDVTENSLETSNVALANGHGRPAGESEPNEGASGTVVTL